LEATKCPLKECKQKIHQLESENETSGILYEEREEEDLEDFDQLNKNNFKSWISFL
jgi:hypothetical protein